MTEKTFPTAKDIQNITHVARGEVGLTQLKINCYSHEEAESLKQQIIQDHEIVERLKNIIDNLTNERDKARKITLRDNYYIDEKINYLKSILENK